MTQAIAVATAVGNGPAFSAYASSNTTLTNATFVKVNFQTKEFDTNTNYSTSTSKFTPTVAGYYILQTGIGFTGSATSESEIGLYKNGSVVRYGMDIITAGGSLLYNIQGNWLVYANGSTDYFEIYLYQNSSRDAVAAQFVTYFTGVLVRSA